MSPPFAILKLSEGGNSHGKMFPHALWTAWQVINTLFTKCGQVENTYKPRCILAFLPSFKSSYALYPQYGRKHIPNHPCEEGFCLRYEQRTRGNGIMNFLTNSAASMYFSRILLYNVIRCVDKKFSYQQVVHNVWINQNQAGNSIFIAFPLFSASKCALIHIVLQRTYPQYYAGRTLLLWNQWI